METMSFEDFNNLLLGEKGEYYAGRWEYYREVIDIVQQQTPSFSATT